MTSTAPVVTVFGSLHYDITVFGPARPRKGETVTGTSWSPKCGGKGGNQAISAAKAGARAVMIGVVGDDDFGSHLVANLKSKNVETTSVRTEPGAKSGMSVAIFDADNDYGAVIVSGSNLTLDATDVLKAEPVAAETKVLVLQNEVPETANLSAASSFRQHGARVLLNAAPARPLSDDLLRLIDILVVNAGEAEALLDGVKVETLEQALSAARRITAFCPCVVVTAGGDGVAYADRDGAVLQIPPIKIDVASTHGAGDEFIGVLAAELAAGCLMGDALRAANSAAALLVSTPEAQRL